jgi:hypothetical protein
VGRRQGAPREGRPACVRHGRVHAPTRATGRVYRHARWIKREEATPYPTRSAGRAFSSTRVNESWADLEYSPVFSRISNYFSILIYIYLLLLNCENFGLYQNFSAVVTGPESAMRPYESLKRPYESPLVHESVQASIASNVGKQEKKNKSFSKVPM